MAGRPYLPLYRLAILPPMWAYALHCISGVGARIRNTAGAALRYLLNSPSHLLLGRKTPSGAYALLRSSVNSLKPCQSMGHLLIHFSLSWLEMVSERLANRCRSMMLAEPRSGPDSCISSAILSSRSWAPSTSSMLKKTKRDFQPGGRCCSSSHLDVGP